MVSVKLILDRTGPAHDGIERRLSALGVPYQRVFMDDDCLPRYGVGDAPCLVIDERIVYHGRLSAADLNAIFAGVCPRPPQAAAAGTQSTAPYAERLKRD